MIETQNGLEFAGVCPMPIRGRTRIQMAHGGGGRLMHELVDEIFLPAFGSGGAEQHDSVVLDAPGKRMAFTTDSYVVRPIQFPGGDIGSLAVHGTVNDLAMSGARPLYLSAGFILEEGLSLATLREVVGSMRDAAERCGVRIVTGDTKVIDRAGGDGLFINTAGVGVVEHPMAIRPASVCVNDAVIVSGDIGRHGMAIMSVREGLEFEGQIRSDSAPVADVVLKLVSSGINVHCLRDITRGGLASTLNEIATATGHVLAIEEDLVPVREDVRAACEILGLDPLHVACEGRFAAFVPETEADRALEIMRGFPAASSAARIGEVRDGSPAVLMKSAFGPSRIVEMPAGEQLPRIC